MAGRRNAVRAVRGLWKAGPARILGRAGALSRRAVVSWAVAVVMLAAGVGVLWWVDNRHDGVDDARGAAVAAAQKLVAEVLSYDHRTADDDLQRARASLTGSFREEFTELSGSLVLPAAKKDGITTRAEVVSSGAIRASSDEVVVLLFVNQTTSSKKIKDTKVDGSRLEVSMRPVDARWLISNLKPV